MATLRREHRPEPPDGGRSREFVLLSSHRLAMGAAAIIFGGALVLLVVMAFEGGRNAVQHIDDATRNAFLEAQWAPLEWLAAGLSIIGSWYVMWPTRIVVAVFLAVRRRVEAFWTWVIAIAIYEPMVGILKSSYARARPPNPQIAVSGYSFPSGHAVVGAAVAIGLVIVLVPAGPRRRRLEVLAGLFAFVMAASRIYLDAHWLTDVVTGTAIGAAVMLGVPAAVHEVGDRVHRRRIREDLAAASR